MLIWERLVIASYSDVMFGGYGNKDSKNGLWGR